MNNFDLKFWNVQSMSEEELISVEGGNIFKDAWEAVEAAAEWVAEAVEDACKWCITHIKARKPPYPY